MSTLKIRHNFISTVPDGPDDQEVRPTQWNEPHVIELDGPAVVGSANALTLIAAPIVPTAANQHLSYDGTSIAWTPSGVFGSSVALNTWSGTTQTPAVQVLGIDASTAQLAIARFSADNAMPRLALGKSRGAAIGNYTVIQNNDVLGEINFQGSDGVDFALAGLIQVVVDGTPGSNDMPGRLVFATTPDGSQTPAERMRITNAGVVVLSGNSPRAEFLSSALTPKLQVLGVDGNNSSIGLVRYAADSNPSRIVLAKSRGTSIGTYNLINTNDVMGSISFQGSDGTDLDIGAEIRVEVDGTPGANDMPGRIIFATTADGAATVTDRIVIDSAGVFRGGVNDGIALGTTSIGFADLFLATGGVINWANSSATIAGFASTGALTFNADPGNTIANSVMNFAVDGTTRLVIETATARPNVNDGTALGTATVSWSDLFLASGAVINFANGDVNIVHIVDSLSFTGAASGYSFDNTIGSTGSAVGYIAFTATSTDAGALQGPYIVLDRASASPAVSDLIGHVQFNGRDSGAASQAYAAVGAVISSPTAGAEAGQLRFYTTTGGALTDKLTLDPAALAPSTNDGLGLGTSGQSFADLFLATGGVISWNSNNMVITHSSGVLGFTGGTWVFGNATALTAAAFAGLSPTIQVLGTTSATSLVGIARFSADVNPARLNLAKSRGASINTQTIVVSGDEVGVLAFLGSDGTDMEQCAVISAQIDGTPGNNDMPGRLMFWVAPDGSATVAEALRIDNAKRFITGGTASVGINATPDHPAFQIHSNTALQQIQAIYRWQADANGASINIAKSNSNSIGTHAVVSNADTIGSLIFRASDGTNFLQAAAITAVIDGTPGANDMPGRLAFLTTADGAASLTERSRIDNQGFHTITGGCFGRNNVVTKTADFTLAATENWVINNKAGATCTVTLPAASSFPGREWMVQNNQAQTLVSASSNVVPKGGGAAGTAILPATATAWAILVSNGTNWVIMLSGT